MRTLLVLMLLAACDSGTSISSSTAAEGTWQFTSSGGFPTTQTLVLGANGVASITVTGGTGCTGMVSMTAIAWTATTSDLTLDSSGSSCDGEVTCTSGSTTENMGCGDLLNTAKVTCPYTLSSDGNTLTVSCASSTAIVYMKQ